MVEREKTCARGMALSPEWAMRVEEEIESPGFPGGLGFEASPPEFLLPSIRVCTRVR
jgi:hypothetical protein